MPRKPRNEDASYVDENLSVLKAQIDKARNYLRDNTWDNIEDPDKREREFKLQKELSSSLLQWTESYMRMSGIMEVYEKFENMNSGKSLRAGQQRSGVQDFVKEYSQVKGILNDIK